MLAKLRRYMTVDKTDPELLQAQLAALTRQVPLLYFMLMTNTMALALTYYPLAPAWLALYFPSALSIACVFRIRTWWKTRNGVVAAERAAAKLQATIYLAGIISVAFTTWSLMLFSYGDTAAKGHVAFYMSITVIGCIFCLMHLRAAALLVTGIVLTPFTLFFASRQEPVFISMAINLALVAAAMIYILLNHYRDFVDLIRSQKAVLAKQRETQSLSDENRRLANLDSLTDLPNRRSFWTELETRIEQASADNRQVALGIIDLDGFKPVNDAFGHSAGDRLLIEAGARLSNFAADGVFAARLGGDEFGIVIARPMSDDALTALGDAICEALQRPYHVCGVTAKVSGSMGLAVYPAAGDSASILFERADFALYHAKQNTRGLAVLFSQEHESEISSRSRIDQELRKADMEREFSIVYQPMVDTRGDMIVGFEALARWDNPVLGRIPPDVFIRAAERCGIIGTVTEVLFAKALNGALQWPKGMRLSFNLSGKDIVSRKTTETVLAILVRSGFPADCLEMEVTETSVMSNFALAAENMEMLTQHGVRVSLDDFGTGHSSLSYVQRLPLSKIKVDRSFITDIERNVLSQNIVKTIVDLCRNIGCQCVVEGIETVEQKSMLKLLGCSLMQGYLFGRPMPVADTLERLQAQSPHSMPRKTA